MTGTIAHRGPDGEGHFLADGIALGHRRLSILDPANGAQPFESHTGRYIVTYNGEIYNSPDLRRSLERAGVSFRTTCDTEVLVALADRDHFAFVNDLEGIFAFALWDKRERRLLLARDGMGVKPLYVREGPRRIAFASELKALRAIPGGDWSVDAQALHHYLGTNTVPGPWTIWRESRKLSPGEVAEWHDGTTRRRTFWSLPTQPYGDALPARAKEQTRELLRASVRGQLLSDVPVGLFLSAGVDSALLLLESARTGHPPDAFCLGFRSESFDERPGARDTARLAGARLTEFEQDLDIERTVLDVARAFDEPYADSSAVALWELCRHVGARAKVALSGEGGDELFGGYETYRAHLLAESMRGPLMARAAAGAAGLLGIMPANDRKGSWVDRGRRFLHAAAMPPADRHFHWKSIFAEREKRRLYSSRWRDEHADLGPTVGLWRSSFRRFRAMAPVAQAMATDTQRYLVNDLLAKADVCGMAHGLEIRVPFLDRRLVEHALRLPSEWKIRLRGRKLLLRELYETRRTRAIFDRPKQGFAIPAPEWLRGRLKPLFLDAVHSRAFRDMGAIDPAAAVAVFRAHEERRRNLGQQLWGLMMLALWATEGPGGNRR